MGKDLKIKVCGMRDVENIAGLISVKPDYLGYIFYSASVRYVGLQPDRKIFDMVPKGIEKVGVFVNADEEELLALVGEYGIGTVQLHGDESAAYCREMRAAGLTVIKAIGSERILDFEYLGAYEGVADYYLFDTSVRQHGGSGKKFDWSVLQKLETGSPWFLSGGLSAEDADVVLHMDLPGMYGVDVNSRFELAPGIKDVGLVGHFIEQMRNGR